MTFERPARRVLASLAGFLLLASCAAPRPTYRVETDRGLVYAPTQEQARTIARWVDELVPAIREQIPHTKSVDLEIWVQRKLQLYRDQEFPETIFGFNTDGGRIHLRDGVEDLKRTLAHELVHAHLDPTWDELPGILEEGLCEWISIQVVPEGRRRAHAKHMLQAALSLGEIRAQVEARFKMAHGAPGSIQIGLKLNGQGHPIPEPQEALRLEGSLEEWAEGRMTGAHYSLGYWMIGLIVERTSLPGLHWYCAEARSEGRESIPVDVVVAAAGLPRDSSVWQRAILAGLGERGVRDMAGTMDEDLMAPLVSMLRSTVPPPVTADELLETGELRLRFADNDHAVELAEVEEFRVALREAWR